MSKLIWFPTETIEATRLRESYMDFREGSCRPEIPMYALQFQSSRQLRNMID